MSINEEDMNEHVRNKNIDDNSKEIYEILMKINNNIEKSNRLLNRIWVLIIVIIIAYILINIFAPFAINFLLIPSYNFLRR